MKHPANPWVLHGWHLSYFTGKVRCYLRFKGLPFVDRPMSLYTLAVDGRRRTGVVVMPLLVTPEGEWWQDSSEMIDRIEWRHPAPAVLPTTPLQRVVSALLEAWGDEWWIPIAMHTRWNHAENYALFEREAGSSLLPRSPKWLQRRAAASIASRLRGYLHSVGIRPNQYAALDSWSLRMLDHLESHFREQAYLLGGRPTLGDFALVGTMYGHLGRDPWPAREWIAPRPALRAWIDRMAESDGSAERAPAALTPGDALPTTLEPVIESICREFLPLCEGILSQVEDLRRNWPDDKPLPRILADVETTLGDAPFARRAMPYTLWMIQRIQDLWRMLPAPEADHVRAAFAARSGERFLTMPIPRLHRVGLRVAFSRAP